MTVILVCLTILPISSVRATDYNASSIIDTPFNKNPGHTGDMLSAANVTVDTGYAVGTTGYGGNFPRFYIGNMAFLSEAFRQNSLSPPVYNIHRLRISVTIKDSSGNALNP